MHAGYGTSFGDIAERVWDSGACGRWAQPMQQLTIPPPLKVEFATVETLWRSTAQTRCVDALILAWVKYEKQLRRLFCFLVFQHPRVDRDCVDKMVAALVQNNRLYPDTLMRAIEEL